MGYKGKSTGEYWGKIPLPNNKRETWEEWAHLPFFIILDVTDPMIVGAMAASYSNEGKTKKITEKPYRAMTVFRCWIYFLWNLYL